MSLPISRANVSIAKGTDPHVTNSYPTDASKLPTDAKKVYDKASDKDKKAVNQLVAEAVSKDPAAKALAKDINAVLKKVLPPNKPSAEDRRQAVNLLSKFHEVETNILTGFYLNTSPLAKKLTPEQRKVAGATAVVFSQENRGGLVGTAFTKVDGTIGRPDVGFSSRV